MSVKNSPQQNGRHQGISTEHQSGFDLPMNKPGRQKKGNAFHVSSDDPQLGRQIGAISAKHAHAFVSQGMNQIDTADEQVGNADEQKIVVLQQSTDIPCDNEDGAGHHNAEYLNETVKEQVAVQAGKIQSE